jgi:hypothetical protein
MNQKLTWMVLVSTVVCCSTARAGNPFHHLVGCSVPDCVGKWCCDDYCPKKEPCVCAPLAFCCDDYCPKKEPCVCTPLNFCCDDYCRKCLPKVCFPPLCDYLQCRPASCCASSASGSPCDCLATTSNKGEKVNRSSSDTKVVARKQKPENASRKRPGIFRPVHLHVLPSK